jgi:hypothetical protein
MANENYREPCKHWNIPVLLIYCSEFLVHNLELAVIWRRASTNPIREVGFDIFKFTKIYKNP